MNLKHLLLLTFVVFICFDAIDLSAAKSKCLNIRNTNIDDGGHQYCNCTYKLFSTFYTSSFLKLTNLMEKLRAWNCSQFKKECENRHFDFNHFTSLVYERFCNYSNLERICSKELKIFYPNAANSTTTKLGEQLI